MVLESEIVQFLKCVSNLDRLRQRIDTNRIVHQGDIWSDGLSNGGQPSNVLVCRMIEMVLDAGDSFLKSTLGVFASLFERSASNVE